MRAMAARRGPRGDRGASPLSRSGAGVRPHRPRRGRDRPRRRQQQIPRSQGAPRPHDDEEALRPKDECPANLRSMDDRGHFQRLLQPCHRRPVQRRAQGDHRAFLVHYLEVLEGEDGAKAGGEWPAFHKSTAHASPLVHDSGAGAHPPPHVRRRGTLLRRFRRPPAKTPAASSRGRDWHAGLDPDHVDHAHPDVGDDEEDPENFRSGFRAPDIPQENPRTPTPARGTTTSRCRNRINEHRIGIRDRPTTSSTATPGGRPGADPGGHTPRKKPRVPPCSTTLRTRTITMRWLAGRDGEVVDGEAPRQREADREFWAGTDGEDEDVAEAEVEPRRWRRRGNAMWGVFGTVTRDRVPVVPHPTRWRRAGALVPGCFLPRLGNGAGPAGRTRTTSVARRARRRATCRRPHARRRASAVHARDRGPDGDGREEPVLAVSHADREYYDNPRTRTSSPRASTWASTSRACTWSISKLRRHTHLDLSTDSVTFRARAVFPRWWISIATGRWRSLGTSVGFLYVLRHDGSTARGWPKQMGEIQAQVAVADLDGDGYQELVRDTRGSVAAFRPDGEELWERHLASLIAQGATIGDVDGDGELEVVVGTSSGAYTELAGRRGRRWRRFRFTRAVA